MASALAAESLGIVVEEPRSYAPYLDRMLESGSGHSREAAADELSEVRSRPKPIKGHRVLATDWDQCQLVLDWIVRTAETFGIKEQVIFAIRMALEEALANAVKHGNRHAGQCIRLDYELHAREFRARVTDEGAGFDPQAVPDPRLPEHLGRPSGRGLLLMRHYMTGVRFNARGNSVELWKCLHPAADDWDVGSTR